jgi:hypothetical protein
MKRSRQPETILLCAGLIGGLGVTYCPAAAQSHTTLAAPVAALSTLSGQYAGAGSIRYGGAGGGTAIQSSWRALPSEARYQQWSSGMLPSEVRQAQMATGSSVFGGNAAGIINRSPGTITYGNPHRNPYQPTGGAAARRAATPQWVAPRLPIASSTRPLAGSTFARPIAGAGSVQYGGAYTPSPYAQPISAFASVPTGGVSTLTPSTRPLSGGTTTHSFYRPAGSYGSVRYGGW